MNEIELAAHQLDQLIEVLWSRGFTFVYRTLNQNVQISAQTGHGIRIEATSAVRFLLPIPQDCQHFFDREALIRSVNGVAARGPEDLVQTSFEAGAGVEKASGVAILEDVPQRGNTEVGGCTGAEDDDSVGHSKKRSLKPEESIIAFHHILRTRPHEVNDAARRHTDVTECGHRLNRAETKWIVCIEK